MERANSTYIHTNDNEGPETTSGLARYSEIQRNIGGIIYLDRLLPSDRL